jgi:hypothetical protein
VAIDTSYPVKLEEGGLAQPLNQRQHVRVQPLDVLDFAAAVLNVAAEGAETVLAGRALRALAGPAAEKHQRHYSKDLMRSHRGV